MLLLGNIPPLTEFWELTTDYFWYTKETKICDQFLNGISVLSFHPTPITKFLTRHFGRKNLHHKFRNYLSSQNYSVKVFLPTVPWNSLAHFPWHFHLIPICIPLYSTSRKYQPIQELMRMFKKIFSLIYLKGRVNREKGGKTERIFRVLALSGNDCNGPGWSQEPGAFSKFRLWVWEPKYLVHFCCLLRCINRKPDWKWSHQN